MSNAISPKIKNMSPLLLVSNLEKAIEFYTGKLGFSIDFKYEDFYAGIIRDGFSIHLKCGENPDKKRESKRSDENPDIIFSVGGIEELYQQLSNKPVKIIQSLRQMPYGMEFYIADPDGHILGFVSAQ